jgi:hypothetical protein
MKRVHLLEPSAYLLLAVVGPLILALFAAPLLVMTGCFNATSLARMASWTDVLHFILKLAALR